MDMSFEPQQYAEVDVFKIIKFIN